jgi:hypothetical protein
MEISHEIVDSEIRLTASDRFRKLITVCSFFVFVSFHSCLDPYSSSVSTRVGSLASGTHSHGRIRLAVILRSSRVMYHGSRILESVSSGGYPKRETMRPIPSTSG